MTSLNLNFTPSRWQQEVIDDFRRFNVLVVHRGSGKTFLCVQLIRMMALAEKEEHAIYVYMAPELGQAKRIAAEQLFAGLEDIPDTRINWQEGWARLGHNGCRIMILGLSDAERVRGLHVNGMVADEFGDIAPEVWGTVLRPTLERKKGWAFLIGTPKKDDSIMGMYHVAGELPDMFQRKWLTIHDTGIYSKNEIEDIKREYIARGDLASYEQEYENNPVAQMDAFYYRSYMEGARKSGRVGVFPYIPGIGVEAALDIGADGTAIWFAQRVKGTINIIDYYQVTGSKLDAVLNVLSGKDYGYKAIHLPWDAEQERVNVDYNIAAQFRERGFPVRVLKKPPIRAGIMEATTLIRNCNFNEGPCKEGLACLDNYSAKVDKKTGLVLPQPKHDKYSHGADAYRYLAIGLRSLGGGGGGRTIIDTSWDILNG
jgi:phage terminase large subunit